MSFDCGFTRKKEKKQSLFWVFERFKGLERVIEMGDNEKLEVGLFGNHVFY